MSSKKAQGLSLSTVIIAIIVLVVLVVLVMIFTGYFARIFTPGVSSCASQGGKCVDMASACTDAFEQQGRYVNTKDCKDTTSSEPGEEKPNGVCCLKGQ